MHISLIVPTRILSSSRIFLQWPIRLEMKMLFLLRRIKSIQGDAPLESVPESIRSQARAIVEAMGALPLALDQAGAYIEETRSSLSDYLKLYRERRQRLMLKRGQDAAGHPESVGATLSL